MTKFYFMSKTEKSVIVKSRAEMFREDFRPFCVSNTDPLKEEEERHASV